MNAFLGIPVKAWIWCGLGIWAAGVLLTWTLLAAAREEDERHGRLEEQQQ